MFMKILFALECANQPTNGTTASCIRFAKELEKKGHEVTIIGCDRIVGKLITVIMAYQSIISLWPIH